MTVRHNLDHPTTLNSRAQAGAIKQKRNVSPFDFLKHFRSLFAIPNGPASLRFLDGLRVLSMVWVHLGHVFIIYLGFIPGMHAYRITESVRRSLPHHFIIGGTFAVDTFFFLSGLLAAYQVCKTLCKLHSFKSRLAAVCTISLQRFVRLIGLVLFLLLSTLALNPNWSNDPFVRQVIELGQTGQMGGCRRYWWVFPLLLTNVSGPGASECIGWTWYISNDWQFFLVGMGLIMIYT